MSSNRGFTLIEILIVLVLIGIGVMSVVPNLTRRVVQPNNTVTFFNSLLNSAIKESKTSLKPVDFQIEIGSNIVIDWDGKKQQIPSESTVSEIDVNSHIQSGSATEVFVYPDGISDYFKITFSNGKTYESIPLLLKVKEVSSEF